MCAIGYIAARIIECAFILVGILSVLAVASLQESTSAGTDATLGSIAYTLAAIKDWTFLLGYLMYKSELVPRRMAQLGLVAGPLICVSGVLVMFGVGQPGGPMQGIATIPEFLWELFLGLYCTFKGFRPSAPILRADTGEERGTALPAASPA